MTVAGILNLLAWLLSALIAGWLIFDMVRVSRNHDEEHLLSIPETFDTDLAGENDADLVGEKERR